VRAPDLGFRLSIGAFAAALLLIVVAIGFALATQSWASLQKFGLDFWRTSTWDPVAGEFGALPFIWGTLYSSVLALLIATPVALGIAVFISELAPQRLARLSSFSPSFWPQFRRSCTGCGASSSWFRRTRARDRCRNRSKSCLSFPVRRSAWACSQPP
jgi:hypothetical protein